MQGRGGVQGAHRPRGRYRHHHGSGQAGVGIFAALAEFERELISERTRAVLAAAKARGRKGGGRPKLSATTIAGVRARMAADPLLDKAALARELGVHRATLWRSLERQP